MAGRAVRVGVIGRGFGARVVAPAFERTDGCAVVDVVSPRDDAAVRALCAREDVDLVSIHSPPFLHLDHVRRAVEAGHAVLCDKPFGCAASQAAEMVALADEAGVVHLVNFEMRFDPVRRRLRDLVASGAVGDVEHLHCSAFLSISRVPVRRYGWLFDAERGGGWIGAWGSHLVDFVRWALGEVVEARAQLRTAVPERPDADGRLHRCTAEDGFSGLLRTAGGTTVAIDSTSAAPVTLAPTMTAFGSAGMLEVTPDQRIVRREREGAREEATFDHSPADLGVPMGRWAEVVRDAVRAGSAPPGSPTFADGLACRRVLDDLRRSPVRAVDE